MYEITCLQRMSWRTYTVFFYCVPKRKKTISTGAVVENLQVVPVPPPPPPPPAPEPAVQGTKNVFLQTLFYANSAFFFFLKCW